MSAQLQLMKSRKDKGASFILQDDVARFLGGEGDPDYEHPLFEPTIDFILLLKNAFVAQSQDMSLGLEQQGIPQLYDPEYFENISLGAGLEGSGRNPHFPPEIRKKMVDYFEDMEGQRMRFSTVDKLADEMELRILNKGQGKTQNVSKSMLRSIIDVIVKRNMAQNQVSTSSASQQKQTMLGKIREATSKLVPNKQQKNNPQFKDQKNKTGNKNQQNNVLRNKVMQDNLDYQHHEHEQHQQHDKPQQKTSDVKKSEQAATTQVKIFGGKANRTKIEAPKDKPVDKTRQELISSAQIDKIAKHGKEEKKPENAIIKTAVKVAVQQQLFGEIKEGQITQQVQTQQKVETTKPVSNVLAGQKDKMDAKQKSDERVSKLDFKDAASLLSKSGVQTTDAVTKPAAQKDLEKLQPQNANKDKQRT